MGNNNNLQAYNLHSKRTFYTKPYMLKNNMNVNNIAAFAGT